MLAVIKKHYLITYYMHLVQTYFNNMNEYLLDTGICVVYVLQHPLHMAKYIRYVFVNYIKMKLQNVFGVGY